MISPDEEVDSETIRRTSVKKRRTEKITKIYCAPQKGPQEEEDGGGESGFGKLSL